MLNDEAKAFFQKPEGVQKVATRAGPIMVEKLAIGEGKGYKAVAGAKMQAVDHLEI